MKRSCGRKHLRFVVQLLAWAVLLAIFMATISPIDERPHLLGNVPLERAGVYFLLGFLFCIGYRRHWLTALSLVLLAALGFEAAQLLVVGRHAHVIDAMEKAAGCAFGFGVGYFATARGSL
jgi:VanZ family protein